MIVSPDIKEFSNSTKCLAEKIFDMIDYIDKIKKSPCFDEFKNHCNECRFDVAQFILETFEKTDLILKSTHFEEFKSYCNGGCIDLAKQLLVKIENEYIIDFSQNYQPKTEQVIPTAYEVYQIINTIDKMIELKCYDTYVEHCQSKNFELAQAVVDNSKTITDHLNSKSNRYRLILKIGMYSCLVAAACFFITSRFV